MLSVIKQQAYWEVVKKQVFWDTGDEGTNSPSSVERNLVGCQNGKSLNVRQ